MGFVFVVKQLNLFRQNGNKKERNHKYILQPVFRVPKFCLWWVISGSFDVHSIFMSDDANLWTAGFWPLPCKYIQKQG